MSSNHSSLGRTAKKVIIFILKIQLKGILKNIPEKYTPNAKDICIKIFLYLRCSYEIQMANFLIVNSIK